jgi:hypothetical protein
LAALDFVNHSASRLLSIQRAPSQPGPQCPIAVGSENLDPFSPDADVRRHSVCLAVCLAPKCSQSLCDVSLFVMQDALPSRGRIIESLSRVKKDAGKHDMFAIMPGEGEKKKKKGKKTKNPPERREE